MALSKQYKFQFDRVKFFNLEETLKKNFSPKGYYKMNYYFLILLLSKLSSIENKLKNLPLEYHDPLWRNKRILNLRVGN